MIFPAIELIDRYVIAKLKYEKTKGANIDEFMFYHQQITEANYDLNKVKTELEELYKVHSSIWSLESELKSGKEENLPLEEIGRRAIKIRDLNNQRIKLKNTAAEKLGSTIKEIKQEHLSQ